MPMRETVYGVLRPHLIGPLGSCRGGHRLWALSITFYAFSVGQFIAERLTEMVEAEPLCPEIWQSMVWEAQVVPLCIGLLATEVTVIMAEAVRPATTGRPATRSSRWLQLLLATPVSPQVLQRIRTHVRVSRTWAAGLGVVMLVSTARQYEQLEANLGRTELQRAVFTIVDTISLVPMLITITGWLLFLTIPSLIVCDDIERNTGRIIRLARKRRIRQPEWDGVMRSVHRANEGTKRLSSLLGPAIKMILLAVGVLACHWTAVFLARKLRHLCHSSKPLVLLTGVEIIAARQHTGDEGSAHKPPPPRRTQVAALSFLYSIAIWLFWAPSKTTASCAQLMEAISRLAAWEQPTDGTEGVKRVSQGPSQHAGPVWRVRRSDDLVRIEGMRRYAADLNGGLATPLLAERLRLTPCEVSSSEE